MKVVCARHCREYKGSSLSLLLYSREGPDCELLVGPNTIIEMVG